MKLQKTYAAFGFVEYELGLNIGGHKVKAMFKDGSITQQGVVPATYVTSNPVIQYAIEQHASFKSGKLKLYRKVAIMDDAETEAVASAANASEPASDAKGEMQQVEVKCLDDAKEYLRETFGLRNIRTKAEAHKAAAEKGVEFVGL